MEVWQNLQNHVAAQVIVGFDVLWLKKTGVEYNVKPIPVLQTNWLTVFNQAHLVFSVSELLEVSPDELGSALIADYTVARGKCLCSNQYLK